MPLVILHHLLNVSVQLATKRGLKKVGVTRTYVNTARDCSQSPQTAGISYPAELVQKYSYFVMVFVGSFCFKKCF
jgi:hypothetical protein